MTRTTSAAVYRQIKSEGLLNLRQIQVYDVLIDAGPLTQAEVWRAVRTEYDEKCDKPSISPRFAELAKLGVIAITGKRSCSVTGYKCTVWDVTDKLPVKPEKEQPYPGDNLYPLFKHMSDNHGLTLLESELQNIVWVVESCKP